METTKEIRAASPKLSGIADEASAGISGQIAAHRELGWESIELRLVDGRNVCRDLDDDAFDSVAAAVEAAGLDVSGFGSAIGNWSRSIGGDFKVDTDELKTAAKRMQRLGTRYIRTMSWIGEGVEQSEWCRETLRRYRELVKVAADNDIVLAHENCTGWAGQGPEETRILLEEIDSPHLVTLFDIGNTIGHGYDPLSFYHGVKPFIGYIHVKDCRRNPDGGHSTHYAYPGEGDAAVKTILADLLASGYSGYVSIEPHVASIVHLGGAKSSPEEMYASYLRYACDLEQIFTELGSDLKALRNRRSIAVEIT